MTTGSFLDTQVWAITMADCHCLRGHLRTEGVFTVWFSCYISISSVLIQFLCCKFTIDYSISSLYNICIIRVSYHIPRIRTYSISSLSVTSKLPWQYHAVLRWSLFPEAQCLQLWRPLELSLLQVTVIPQCPAALSIPIPGMHV